MNYLNRILIVSAVSLSPAVCRSASTETVYELEPLTVVSLQTDQNRLPYSAASLFSEDLLEQQFRTTPDTFKYTPSVMVQKTAHGQGSPYIRGFTGFRNVLLVDGVRLNNSVFRDGPNQYWNTVDPFSIDSYRIVKGAGSVAHGSDAIGGVVNARTKTPSIFAKGTEQDGQISGQAFARVSSAEQSTLGRIEANYSQGGHYGGHLGLSVKNFGDLKTGEGNKVKNSGYDEWAVDTKHIYQFQSGTSITFAYQQLEQDDVWRTHRTIFAESWKGTTLGNEQQRILDQERRLAYLRLDSQEQPTALYDAMSATVSWHEQDEERDRIRNDGRRDIQGIRVNTLGLDWTANKHTRLGRFEYGINYYHDWVDSYRDNYDAGGNFTGSSIQGPVGDDSRYTLLNAFVQDELELESNFDLIIGANFAYAEADVGKSELPSTGEEISFKDDWSTLTTSIRGIWQPTENYPISVFGGISQGFRAPNLSDLSRLDTARSNEIETPSLGLDPEKFILTEMGIRYESGTVTANATYYYTFVDDMIIRTPTKNIIDGDIEVIKQNSGKGFIQGIELESNWQMADNWNLWGNISWMDGEVDTFPTSNAAAVREPIDRLMPLTAHIGLRYTADERHWIELRGSFADKADELSTRDQGDTQRIPPGGTPGYGIASIYSGFEVTPNFTLYAVVENLFDKDYRVHGSGQNEAGRNLILSGRYRF